jgi:hypothetical protein
MGNRASTRSHEEKQHMKTISSTYIDKEIRAIEDFQKQINSSSISSELVPVKIENKLSLKNLKASTNKLLDIMKKQLKREDKPLIKADIVAIIISLKPELVNEIATLDSYTVKQLNSMLRSIIYDINRIKIQHNINVQSITSCKLLLIE